MKIQPLVSVIVPTFNSEKTIGDCLKSIKKQTYKKLEIIVVDNFSTDRTTKIASQYTDRVFQKGPERSWQKNWGGREARGDYLLMVDSDMVLDKGVVEECVAVCLKNQETAIVIPEISTGPGFWAASRALEKKCYFEDPLIEVPRFFSKKVFWKVQGFTEFVGFEDYDFRQKLEKAKIKISRIESLIFHQEGRFFKTLAKKYYYGKNFNPYFSRYGLKAFPKVNPIRMAFFRNWRLFLRHPILGLGVFILKSTDFLACLGGLLSYNLSVLVRTKDKSL